MGNQAGYNLTTGDANIDIGNQGVSTDDNIIRIGSGQTQTFVAGIYGATASSGALVYVNSSGQLGTVSDTPIVAGSATDFTGTLDGDVTGKQKETVVAKVGGQTAANVASGVIAANAAASDNALGTIVKRDAVGNFSAGTITASLAGNATTATTANNFSGSLSGEVTGPQSTTVVGSVGGQTAANVASGVIAANAATDANTASTIVKRDTGGNFLAGSVTLNGNLYLPATTASAGILYSGGSPMLHAYGSENSFLGRSAGNFTMTGTQNTANGGAALSANTTGSGNTASGGSALNHNTSGSYNTATGYRALISNTSGDANTANGNNALMSNTSGSHNTADGAFSLPANTTSTYNTAVGQQALNSNTSGGYNTALGFGALPLETTGNYNIALGFQAGQYISTGDKNIDIGSPGVAGDNNTIRVGEQGTQTSTYVAGIYDTSADASWLGVYVDSNGHLGARATGVGGSGVTSVTGSQHITANPTTGDVVVGSDATPLDTFGAIVSRDGNGSFNAMNIALGSAVNSPSQTGVVNLPTTTASGGMITLGGTRVLHAYGIENFFGGASSGNFTLTGGYNTGLGYRALASDTTGQFNTGVGAQALPANTTGDGNTAIGYGALTLNVSGSHNTANGQSALGNNTIGSCNTADGGEALFSNSSGSDNTANGYWALFLNTDGSGNTANGKEALMSNAGGSENSATGHRALFVNTTGRNNAAHGASALYANASGSWNTANGSEALYYNTSGNYNIALGYQAGDNLTTGDNNIDIGNQGVAAEANTIRIGSGQAATYIAGISGVTISPSGGAVYINANGQLGTVNSSRRFKEAIQDMASQSDILLSLRPVTFHYKPDLDPQATPQFGLIAEEVEKVAPQLVLRDAKGEVLSVRYEQINAMLLNEFLKQHRTVEEQSGEIQNLKHQNDSLEKRLNELEKAVARIAEKSGATFALDSKATENK